MLSNVLRSCDNGPRSTCGLLAVRGTASWTQVRIVDKPAFGKFEVAKDGKATFTIAEGADIGFSKVRYVVTDAQGLEDVATVSIRLACGAVKGTTQSEKIFTGELDDADECDNKFAITGAGGSDTFVISRRQGGRDTITDFDVANDKLDLVGFTATFRSEEVVANSWQEGSDTMLELEGGVHTILLQGVTQSKLSAKTHFVGKLAVDNIYEVTDGATRPRYSQRFPTHKDMATLTTSDARAQGNRNYFSIANTVANQPRTMIVWDGDDEVTADGKAFSDSGGTEKKFTATSSLPLDELKAKFKNNDFVYFPPQKSAIKGRSYGVDDRPTSASYFIEAGIGEKGSALAKYPRSARKLTRHTLVSPTITWQKPFGWAMVRPLMCRERGCGVCLLCTWKGD